ncbi:MAG: hypothetical protein NTW67_00970 [Candidatus Woesearchaeota archaeon]|nr:hypothetical protein [Candidatus Woesearchaeota archaeon]
MNPEQAKKELDAAKEFYNLLLRQKISNPIDMLINYMITPYNQIMSDERLRDWILENEELATKAYKGRNTADTGIKTRRTRTGNEHF